MAFGIGPVLTMGAVEALDRHGTRRAEGELSARSSSPANGWARCSSPSRRRAPMSARCAPRPSAPPTAPIASPGRRSSSPMASTTSPTTSSTSCSRACPMRRRARKGISLFLVPKFLVERRRLARRAQRRALPFDRAQARHPRLADLHDGLWRQGRRDRLAVGEENRGLACMFTMMNNARLAVGLQGVAHRGARDAAGARLCAASASRAARGANGSSADHRASRRAAHAADHAGADRAPRARSATRPARRDRPRASRQGRRGAQGRATSAPRCSRRSPRRSRPTSASRSPRSACRCMAAWASSRRPAPRSIIATRASRDLRRHQRHPGDRSRHAQAAAVGRRGGARLSRRAARHRRGACRRRTIRPSARPARGSPRRSTASTARPTWLLGKLDNDRPTRRSPARRRICGCSARRRRLHAGRGGARGEPRSMAAPTRPVASRSRASLPRTSPCRPAGWKPPSPKARIRFQPSRCPPRKGTPMTDQRHRHRRRRGPHSSG